MTCLGPCDNYYRYYYRTRGGINSRLKKLAGIIMLRSIIKKATYHLLFVPLECNANKLETCIKHSYYCTIYSSLVPGIGPPPRARNKANLAVNKLVFTSCVCAFWFFNNILNYDMMCYFFFLFFRVFSFSGSGLPSRDLHNFCRRRRSRGACANTRSRPFGPDAASVRRGHYAPQRTHGLVTFGIR